MLAATKKAMKELLRKHSTVSEYSGYCSTEQWLSTRLHVKSLEGFKNISVQIQSPKLNPNICDESLALMI